MKRCLSAAVVCGLLLIVRTASAQERPNPIDVIKSGHGAPNMSLAEARASLAEEGEGAVPKIVKELLAPAGSDAIVRLNAAIALADLATKVATPQLKQALVKCAQDQSPGVQYWGLIGLTRFKDLPDAELSAVVEPYLNSAQPRLLRLAATDVARERKLKAAVPWLMYMLEQLLPSYKEARDRVFAEGQHVGPEGPGPAPPLPFPPEGVAAPVRPAVPIDIDRTVEALTLAQLQPLGDTLEALNETGDIRRIGSALEILTDHKDEKAWGFLKQPPWALHEPILKALGWFQKNRKDYPGGPKLSSEEPGKEKR
jgi:hypothetical protein